MSEQIVILGVGGNCVDMLDIISAINEKHGTLRYRCRGFLDDNETLWNKTIAGLPVLGPLSCAPEYSSDLFINGIGSTKTYKLRKRITEFSGISLDQFVTLIHPSAVVSQFSSIGQGCVVFPQVVLCANSRIDDHVIILAGSVINHDSKVGAYTIVTSGVCVSGGCSIEESCYLGSRSVVRGNLSLGKGALVGMGSVVIRDVPANEVVVGNPAAVLSATRAA